MLDIHALSTTLVVSFETEPIGIYINRFEKIRYFRRILLPEHLLKDAFEIETVVVEEGAIEKTACHLLLDL